MALITPVCLVVLLSVGSSLATSVFGVESTTFRINLGRRSGFRSCTKKDGTPGRCVHTSFCNENQEIEVGGNIIDSELRSAECRKYVEWCCSDKSIVKPPPISPRKEEDTCKVTERPGCPWCVYLYRDGKDRRKLPSGFFCMGALIGPNVILTTGTCMLQAHNQTLWAHVPSSADPNDNYTVKFQLVHPDYNTGTRENDLSLLVMDREVVWGASGPQGACLGLQNALVGDCIGAGVDDDMNIQMIPLVTYLGNCGSGASSDASCGEPLGQSCSLVPGSPVMCRVNGGPFITAGLARLPCSVYDPPKALLGNLNRESSWLINQLKSIMGLQEKDFIKTTP